MGSKESAVTYVIQIGAFPLISACCGFHYTFSKHKKDIVLCCVPSIFYAISALLYGMWSTSWITVLIYMAAYFICCYLGMILCELFKPGSKAEDTDKPVTPEHRSNHPSRVKVQEHEIKSEAETPDAPAEGNIPDIGLDTSTTDDDIEAILRDIRNRKNQ